MFRPTHGLTSAFVAWHPTGRMRTAAALLSCQPTPVLAWTPRLPSWSLTSSPDARRRLRHSHRRRTPSHHCVAMGPADYTARFLPLRVYVCCVLVRVAVLVARRRGGRPAWCWVCNLVFTMCVNVYFVSICRYENVPLITVHVHTVSSPPSHQSRLTPHGFSVHTRLDRSLERRVAARLGRLFGTTTALARRGEVKASPILL